MTQNKSYDANTLFAAIAIIPFLVPNGLQTFSFMRIVYDLKYNHSFVDFWKWKNKKKR